jgi:YggT family protein
VVKPFNGLDVSPIVWVALLSFLSEILTGQQGILSMIERKGI